MRLTRREALATIGLGGFALVTGCSLLAGTPVPQVLRSTAPLPEPFAVPLPVPPVARPVRRGDADHYDLTARQAVAAILPGLRTPVWGYDGVFPGPTIETRRDRRTVVRLTNGLAEPTVLHLHGGHTPAASDGHPADLVLPGATREYDYPMTQRAATLWYHDHRMDHTGPQVWRGLAGLFLVRDDEEDALPLPKGEREIPLVICDRSFAADGTMPYPGVPGRPGAKEAYMGGVLGDVTLVNGAPWPVLKVARARYRLRVVNASNARPYELSTGGPIVQIGTDGGLLPAPRTLDSVRLAPGERADLVVDFAAHRIGDRVELRDLADDGRVMRFDVDRDAPDDSAIPAVLSRVDRLDPASATATRDFEFTSGNLHGGTGWLINGKPYAADRVDATVKLGATEIWRFTSDVSHPIHLHLAHFQVIADGTPNPEWKDTVELREAQTLEVIARFDGYPGRYVFHCHNLEHEDMAMMATFDVIP
ncbi:multicopper oxidase family protein [Herbidospora yilanensis]|uniref:multicopper oxidase family protein n=1 Tax=Herbidospora yilanensis TaxID=354426 RepID=UPI000785458B|nr:multicopper oxidase family protein [Herbidospora yilanensis]